MYETSWEEQVRIARELYYPKIVIEKLKNEPDQLKRTNILYDARRGLYDDYRKKARKK